MLRRLSLTFCAILASVVCLSQSYPTCCPDVEFVTADGETKKELGEAESAPLRALFMSNAQCPDGWNAFYTWTITHMSTGREIRRGRPDEADMEYTFIASGTYSVSLEVTFTKKDDPMSPIEYPEPGQEQESVFMVSIQQSKLELPNAFSPNGDGYNDVFRVKDGHQSIVRFEASIFNRWGQKLYSWDDIRGGWDGRYGGSVVKDGTYYIVVKALGADGVEYNMHRNINVLTTSKQDENNKIR